MLLTDVFTNSVGKIEVPDFLDLWIEVSSFLRVEIPEEITSKSCIIQEMLDVEGIEIIASTRRPFTCLRKAAKLIVDGQEIVLTVSYVSENECGGHFPEGLEVPLLLFCKAMALSGELLINWIEGRRMITRACGAEGVKSLIKDINLLRPPAHILTLVEVSKKRMGLTFVSSYSWIDAKPVAKVKWLPYVISDLKPKRKPRIV